MKTSLIILWGFKAAAVDHLIIIIIIIIIIIYQNSCNTVFHRDMVCLRNISVDTLHKESQRPNAY